MKILSSILVGTMLIVGSMANAFDVDLTCSYVAENLRTGKRSNGDIRIKLSEHMLEVKPLSYVLDVKTNTEVARTESETLNLYTAKDITKGFFYAREDEYVIYPNKNSYKTASINISRITGKLSGTYIKSQSTGLSFLDGYCSKTVVRF